MEPMRGRDVDHLDAFICQETVIDGIGRSAKDVGEGITRRFGSRGCGNEGDAVMSGQGTCGQGKAAAQTDSTETNGFKGQEPVLPIWRVRRRS